MKKTKRSYGRKRVVRRKKRTFRAKRIGTTMMGRQQRAARYKFTQVLNLFSGNTVTNTRYPFFSVCLLNNASKPTLGLNFSPLGSQTYSQVQAVSANYEEFTITGCRIKYLQTETTGSDRLWYQQIWMDPNSRWNPTNENDTILINNRSNMQTIPLTQNHTWTRYFSLDKLKKRLGISWSKAGSVPDYSYYGQLDGQTNPSFNVRSVFSNDLTPSQEYGAVEITWYYAFRGFKPVAAV